MPINRCNTTGTDDRRSGVIESNTLDHPFCLVERGGDGTSATRNGHTTAPTVLVIDDVGLIRLRSPAEADWFFGAVNTR